MASKFLYATDIVSSPTSQGRYPFSIGTLWNQVRDGRFPAPVRISPGRVAWPVEVLDEHDQKLIEGSRVATRDAAFKRSA